MAILIPKRIKIRPKTIDCTFTLGDIYLQQESNPLKRILESMTSNSHDQELMEERRMRLSLSLMIKS